MSATKFDHEPLLAPGCHRLTLNELKAQFVDAFEGTAYTARKSLFLKFEQLYQDLLTSAVRCSMYVDGSFLTKKPIPDDFDVRIGVDEDAYNLLTDEQQLLLERINTEVYLEGLDAFAFSTYPRGSELYGSYSDIKVVCLDYGIEHSAQWLKGYAVLRLHETDVGLRISS